MLERKTREQGLQLGEMAGTPGEVPAVGEEEGERLEKADSGAVAAKSIVAVSILVPSFPEMSLGVSWALVIGFTRALGRISLSMYSLTYFAMLVLTP